MSQGEIQQRGGDLKLFGNAAFESRANVHSKVLIRLLRPSVEHHFDVMSEKKQSF